MEHEGAGDTNCYWSTWNNPERIGKGTGRLRSQKISRDYPDFGINKIGQNTEESPGDLRRLVLTQTSVRKRSKE